MSAKPPAANGITMRIGLLGNGAVCAVAGCGAAVASMALTHRQAIDVRIFAAQRIRLFLPRRAYPVLVPDALLRQCWSWRDRSVSRAIAFADEHPGLLCAQPGLVGVDLVLMAQDQ